MRRCRYNRARPEQEQIERKAPDREPTSHIAGEHVRISIQLEEAEGCGLRGAVPRTRRKMNDTRHQVWCRDGAGETGAACVEHPYHVSIRNAPCVRIFDIRRAWPLRYGVCGLKLCATKLLAFPSRSVFLQEGLP